MPGDGENNRKSAINRVHDLNSLFTSVNKLEQSIAEDNAEKELRNLEKVWKYKQKIYKDQLKLEEQHQKKLEKIRATYRGKALKEELAKAQELYDKEKQNIVDLYKARVEYEEKIDKQWKGSIGKIIGSFKKANNSGDWSTGAAQIINGIADFAKQLDSSIETIAGYQTSINTRLNGSTKRWDGVSGISNRITSITGASPYVKTADVMSNVNSMVSSGIAYNVEMRAFLQTVKESIATTFDATNGTLLQLIRIQKQDTTASRLGMEAALNAYLNSMFQTTEYLTDAASSVKSSIYEASALMSGKSAVGFEYQVQKWLGSLYSSGMDSTSVNSIASALGSLGSGDYSSLTGSGMQNLLVMAASRAGLAYGDLLINGLDESNTNKLLKSMTEYLASIASDNHVVQSAYAKVFGLKSSDIKAASNLTGQTNSISGSYLGYGASLAMLTGMMDTMATRVSLGGMLSNMWSNVQYSLAEGIANNPALYAIWKAAGVLDETMGGIPVPSVGTWAAGTGADIDLETSVANIMRVGALGGSLLGSIGKLTSSLTSNVLPSTMLAQLGIYNGLDTVTRGAAKTLVSGITTSASIYRGNQSSADVYESTMTEADKQKDEAYNRTVSADDEDDEEDIKLRDLNETNKKILELIQNVVSGEVVKVSFSNDIFGSINR